MTGCRIGKVTLKSGGTIYKFPDRNLTIHDSGHAFEALDRANQLVREGQARMVAVAVLKSDDSVMSGFSKKDNVGGLSVLGAIEDLRNLAMNWWSE